MAILKTKLVTSVDVTWNRNHIADGDFTTSDDWTAGAKWTVGGGVASFAHVGGGATGSLSQALADLAIAMVVGITYTFTYTLSNIVGSPLESFTLAGGGGGDTVDLEYSEGTHSVQFTPAASGSLVILATNDQLDTTFDLTDVSLVPTAVELFSGYITATLVGSQTTFFLAEHGIAIPAVAKIPVKEGVVSTEVQLFQNSEVSPPGTTYTLRWYDNHNTLLAAQAAVLLTADEETLTIPTLD